MQGVPNAGGKIAGLHASGWHSPKQSPKRSPKRGALDEAERRWRADMKDLKGMHHLDEFELARIAADLDGERSHGFGDRAFPALRVAPGGMRAGNSIVSIPAADSAGKGMAGREGVASAERELYVYEA